MHGKKPALLVMPRTHPCSHRRHRTRRCQCRLAQAPNFLPCSLRSTSCFSLFAPYASCAQDMGRQFVTLQNLARCERASLTPYAAPRSFSRSRPRLICSALGNSLPVRMALPYQLVAHCSALGTCAQDPTNYGAAGHSSVQTSQMQTVRTSLARLALAILLVSPRSIRENSPHFTCMQTGGLSNRPLHLNHPLFLTITSTFLSPITQERLQASRTRCSMTATRWQAST